MYLFTWNSSYLIEEAVTKWKYQFIEKYGDFNCVHFKDIATLDTNVLAENMLGTSFLAEKKLIIIDISKDIPEHIENFLQNSLERVPQENIVVFSYPNPDKRKKLYKFLQKHTEVKEFSTAESSDVYTYFSKKYTGQIDTTALQKLVDYKAGNERKIDSEIQKLLITKEKITVWDIKSHVAPELEESIFQLVDNILNKRYKKVVEDIQILTNDSSVYLLYNSLLANLRTSLYIMKLKNISLSRREEIVKILQLGKRSFLVNKSYKISYSELENKFLALVAIDKKMKTGTLLGSEDEVIIWEIEKALIF